MNVLVKYSNNYIDEHLEDLIQKSDNTIFFANTVEKAIRVLNDNKIEKIFVEINMLEEVNLIEYVNKYFPNVQVLITTNTYNESILEVIKQGIFAIIREPLNLKTILSHL